MLQSVEEMVAYFSAAVTSEATRPTEGLINALVTAEVDGDRLTDEEIVANVIVTMVGGQETTTNLIGNGLLTLLRRPDELERLRSDPELMPSAVEELLRYESPSQHTARLAPADAVLGDSAIPEGDAVIAVMGAANRDPERFPDPDGSISPAPTTATSPSAGRGTSASARRWRGSRGSWRSRPCCHASASSRSRPTRRFDGGPISGCGA